MRFVFNPCSLTRLFRLVVFVQTLVTQPVMQRRLTTMELRSMDSQNQILCRFQNGKQKVLPPSLPCTKEITLYSPKGRMGVKGELFT